MTPPIVFLATQQLLHIVTHCCCKVHAVFSVCWADENQRHGKFVKPGVVGAIFSLCMCTQGAQNGGEIESIQKR